jgi:hypothetical protein
MVRRSRLIGYFPILYNPQLEVPLREVTDSAMVHGSPVFRRGAGGRVGL